MENEKSVTSSSDASSAPLIPLSIALYESNGLIFELYQGGQPYQPVVIRWERLKPVTAVRKDGFDSQQDNRASQGSSQENNHEIN